LLQAAKLHHEEEEAAEAKELEKERVSACKDGEAIDLQHPTN